ncbi:MAG: HTH-type transcriptional activator IlvY [Desulfocapsaceae bacterium]|nr:HTH-type transcriptional activator IlvY [Desulfocapsaceae bacterium]
MRDLQLFRHLASTLHFGRTSRRCNITPSGLTRTIQRLENELDQQLFRRNKRSVTLTHAGEILVRYSDEILNLHRKMRNELSGEGHLYGELSLYCSVTAILSILPTILERFKILHPQIQIHLQTGDAAMALDRLAQDETDISIAALPDNIPDDLEIIKLLKTPLIFIAPKNHDHIVIYNDKKVDWQQTPLILAEKGLSRQRVESWFQANKWTPNLYSLVAGNEAIIALVSMGCGVGVVPELVLEKSTLKNSVQILTDAPSLLPFSVGVCTNKKNLPNPIVSAFWQNVKETLAYLETPNYKEIHENDSGNQR